MRARPMRQLLILALLLHAGAANAGCIARIASGWENGCNFTVGVRWHDEGTCQACSCTALIGGNDTADATFSGQVGFAEIKSARIVPARGDCRN